MKQERHSSTSAWKRCEERAENATSDEAATEYRRAKHNATTDCRHRERKELFLRAAATFCIFFEPKMD